MDKRLWNTPIQIGNTTLKNRIVYPPLSTNWGTELGCVTDKIIDYYRAQAQGGCAMIVVEGTAVSKEGRGSNHSLCFHDEAQVESFSKIVKEIKSEGCLAAIQIMHSGGQGNEKFTGYTPLSPSGVPCASTGCSSRALTLEEITEIKGHFAHTATLVSQAGFDAIELHLAHGYLLHEFLSPHTNKREDSYGGSLENRTRLVREIISEVKKAAPKLIIGARISGEDYLDDGINKEMNEELIPLLEQTGVQYFHVTAGIYDTGKVKHDAMKRGEFFNYSKYIKGIATKPVIGVGKVLDLDQAETHLIESDCDLVAIGRGLLSDPMMVKKVQNGEPFNKCIECRKCMYLRYGREYLKCPVRPV